MLTCAMTCAVLSFGNVKIILNNPNPTSLSICTLFGYVFIIILIRRREFFIDNFRDQVMRFR